MPIIKRTDLDIPDRRQRKTITGPELAALKDSILRTGILLHAPVVQKTGDRYTLVAGERRTKAIDLIAAEGKVFWHNNVQIMVGELPVVLIDEALSELQKGELEFDENDIREAIPWQDRVAALAFLHDLRKAANPSASRIEIARDLIAEQSPASISPSTSAPMSALGLSTKINEAVVLAKHLDDPAIAKARNATEAFNLVIKKQQDAYQAELITRGKKRETGLEVRHGSLLEILPKLDSGQFDLILADPPYGINVGSGGFRSRTVHHHNYDDSPDTVRQLLSVILTEGFRVCKPRANLFVFCDIDFFGWLKDNAARAGWEPFRTPITWQKSDSEGLAPWGREGFRRTTEWIFFARKGQRGLIHSPIDVLRHNRVSRDDREYGPEKPIPLLRDLLSAACIPGDYVLDPCCGSGSTLVAAKELNMKALGIEADETAYNLALVKSQQPSGLEAL